MDEYGLGKVIDEVVPFGCTLAKKKKELKKVYKLKV